MDRATELFESITTRGVPAIEELITTFASEELYLDFKQSRNHGNSDRLEDDDRQNFASAISGFSNSEGGIIIWGVECKPNATVGDVAQCKRPIKKPERFASWLQGAAHACTSPAHVGIEIKAIPATNDEGFVVALIRKSNMAPHQVLVGKNQGKYLIRSGSSFTSTPHGVLAGLFGKRPSPDIRLMFVVPSLNSRSGAPADLNGSFTLLLRNKGFAAAKNLFTNVMMGSPGQGCHLACAETDEAIWFRRASFGNQVHSAITGYQIRVAPESYALPYRFDFTLRPPFADSFSIRITYGADGAPTGEMVLKNDQTTMAEVFNRYMQILSGETVPQNTSTGFVREFFGIPEIGTL